MDPEAFLRPVLSMSDWLGANRAHGDEFGMQVLNQYFEEFAVDLPAFGHDFHPVVPPDEHILDAVARGWFNLPESVTQTRAEAGTVAVVSAVDPCDVCGQPGRYDTTAQTTGGQTAVTLCVQCFGRHGNHRLGPGRSVLLLAPTDVPEPLREQIIPLLQPADQVAWERPANRGDGWDGYRRWGFRSDGGAQMRAWIFGVELTAERHYLGAIQVSSISAPSALTMGFGGASTDYWPLDMDALDVRQCLLELLTQVRSHGDQRRIEEALAIPGAERDAAVLASIRNGTHGEFLRVGDHAIGRTAGYELAREAAERSADLEVLDALAHHPFDMWIRVLALQNPHCPDATLLVAARNHLSPYALVRREDLPAGALEDVVRNLLMDVSLDHHAAITALLRSDFPEQYVDRVVGRIHEAGPEARKWLAERVHDADPALRDRVHLHLIEGSKRIPSTAALLEAVLGSGEGKAQRLAWLRGHGSYKVRAILEHFLPETPDGTSPGQTEHFDD